MNEDDKTEAFSIFFDDGICGIDVTLKEASAPGDRISGEAIVGRDNGYCVVGQHPLQWRW